MKKYILMITIFLFILTGCGTIDTNQSESLYDEQYNELINENEQLQIKSKNLELANQKLENEIKNIRLESKNHEETNENNHIKTIQIIRVTDDQIDYIIRESDINTFVSIIGDNANEMVEDYETIEIDGIGEGETLRFEVIGSIYDFKLCELNYTEETGKFYDGEVIAEYEEIRNTAVNIELYLPCGMALQTMQWKDSHNTIHRVNLSQDGYGMNGQIIWSN